MKISFSEIKSHLEGYPQKLRTGIYLHYPFCLSKCPYCHFFSLIRDNHLHHLWLEIIKKEIKATSEHLSDFLIIDTVYFGGGTPSLLEPGEIKEILSILTDRFPAGLTEITLEVNPDSQEEWLSGWRQAGINRLSVGAQSFDDRILKILGRRHSSSRTCSFVKKAREAGFENINLDLMAGIPGELPETHEVNISILNQLKVAHVSVYLLEEVEQVPFKSVWESNPVSEDEMVRWYKKYRQTLRKAGYQQYEISNYSQPGFRCQHNLKYWEYKPFLGFGPSAASHLGSLRWQNKADLLSWPSAIDSGSLAVDDFLVLDLEKQIAEKIAFGLRLTDGVNWGKLKKEYRSFDFSGYEKKIAQLVSLGSLSLKDSRLTIPGKKFLIANSIISDLLF